MLFLFYKMFNPPISILSVAWISVVAWWLAVPKENTKNATQCLWLKQTLKRLSLASGVLWVYTTSANMKVLIFCPVLAFLLLRSALGEDTGESECSHSRLQLHQQPACCKKKKKKTLSVRPNLLIVLFSVVKCWLFSFYSVQLRRLMWQFDTTQAVLANWERRRAAVVSASCFVN